MLQTGISHRIGRALFAVGLAAALSLGFAPGACADEADGAEDVETVAAVDEAVEPIAAEKSTFDAADPASAPDAPQPAADDAAAEADALLPLAASDGLVDGHEYVIRPASGAVLEVAGNSKKRGGNVRIWAEHRGAWQRWKASHDADGYLVLTSVSSGMALDVSNAKAARGQNVWQWSANGTKAQKWLAVRRADGTYKLASALGGNLVLDVSGGKKANGTNVQIWTSNDTAAQRFAFEDVTAMQQALDARAKATQPAVPAGEYIIRSSVAETAVLDMAGSSTANRGNAQIWSSSMTAAQRWIIAYGADGYATITNKNSGLVLDAADAKSVNFTNVQQYAGNGTRAQKWLIEPVDDGYRLTSALRDGLVLDVSGAKSANGTNVQLYAANGTAAQTWDFAPPRAQAPAPANQVDLPTDGWQRIVPAAAPDRVLTLGNGSGNGTKVVAAASDGGLGELFRFSADGGWWKVLAGGDGLWFDISGGNVIPGITLHVWNGTAGNRNQQFSVQRTAHGLAFVNVATGLAIAYDAGKLKTAVYDPDDIAQSFELEAADVPLPQGVVSMRVTTKPGVGVTVAAAGEGGNVALASYDGALTQKWLVTRADDARNAYTFESLSSGLLLAAEPSGNVGQHAATGGDEQLWAPDVSSGGFCLQNLSSGKMLDLSGGQTAAGTNISTWKRNDSFAQRFSIEAARPLESGTYLVRSAQSGLGLAVAGASVADGANVALARAADVDAQKWFFTYEPTAGTYLVSNAITHKKLETATAAGAAGDNVDVRAGTTSARQRWRVAYAGGGAFTLTSALPSGSVLEAAGSSDGADVRVAAAADAAQQRWTFSPTNAYSGATMNGIDISHWNENLDVSAVDAQFVIAKATEGTTYTDPTLRTYADAVLASGKLLGSYHFARVGDPVAQADYYVDTVAPYLGRMALFLDWENRGDENVIGQGPAWAKRWLDRVYQRTGTRPVIYMSYAVIGSYDWSLVAAEYELWCARYGAAYQNAPGGVGFQENPLLANSDYGPWSYPTIYQYTSNGKLAGYAGGLDLDKFFGPAARWAQLAAAK